MNESSQFLKMFTQGPCDLIFLIPKNNLERWVKLLGEETYLGRRSYSPADYTIQDIAQKFFGIDLSQISYYTLVTKDGTGRWKVVLDDSDMISNPLASNSLKRICQVVE